MALTERVSDYKNNITINYNKYYYIVYMENMRNTKFLLKNKNSYNERNKY